MKKVLLFIILSASYANAKIVFLDVFVENSDTPYTFEYTVDPNMESWQFKNAVLRATASEKYVIARDSKEGLVTLNPSHTMGCYGKSNDAPVLLKVVLKKEDMKEEEPLEEGKDRCK